MIEVKMARNLTRDGVEGLRWVLLDPPDTLPMPLEAAPVDPRLYQLAGRALADTFADTPADPPIGANAGTAADTAAGPAPFLDPSAGPAHAGERSVAAQRQTAPPRIAPQARVEADLRSTPRQTLMLGLLKTLVLVLALGAAVATAWRVIGPPRTPGDGVRPAARPANGTRPAVSVRAVTAQLALQPGRQPDQEVSR